MGGPSLNRFNSLTKDDRSLSAFRSANPEAPAGGGNRLDETREYPRKGHKNSQFEAHD